MASLLVYLNRSFGKSSVLTRSFLLYAFLLCLHRYSPLDVFKPVDLQKYPNYAKASEYEVTIGPGDILYVPSGWWHAVYSETATMSVNYICADIAGNGEWYQHGPAIVESARILTLCALQQLYLFLVSLLDVVLLREPSSQKKVTKAV